MKRATNRVVVICLLGACLLSISPVVSRAQTTGERSKKILLVHSYHPEYQWTDSITTGVNAALRGKNVELEIVYMDTKRDTSETWKRYAGDIVQRKIESWNPDVVITVDDNAQIYAAQRYLNKKPNFVFCGVNAEASEYGFPAANVTGILERPHFTASLELLNQILGNKLVKTIAVMSDTGSTSQGALDYMREEKRSSVVVAGYHLIDTIEKWMKRLLEYNPTMDALAFYTYHTLKQSGQELSMDPSEVMRWTMDVLRVPSIGFLEFSIADDGILCGVVESGEEHGYEAAQMALALLEGRPISEIPIKTATKGIRMINLKTAQKLGIVVPDSVLMTMDRIIR